MTNPFTNQLPRRDGFTWLRFPETGGTWECPNAALEAWVARGWEPCEPPVEVNAATAHWVTAESEPADESAAPEKPAKKAAKAASQAAAQTDQKPEE